MVKRIVSNMFRQVPLRVLALAIVAFVALTLPVSACHIGDLVWDDLNGNGIQDAGEPGVSGVTVKLYYSNDVYVGKTTTNPNGMYSLSAPIANRNYKIRFFSPSGYEFSPMDATDDRWDSDAKSDGWTNAFYVGTKDVKTVDAGIYRPAGVGNFVWEDKNNNGIQDAGEPGVEGITVKLYTCDEKYMASTTTDSTGFYEFTGLAPGSYFMQFVKPEGSVFALKAQGDSTATDSDASDAGTTDCFTLISGQYYEDIDAGIYFPPEQIPEFPTIALPIAAILGLAFIMQRRKE